MKRNSAYRLGGTGALIALLALALTACSPRTPVTAQATVTVRISTTPSGATVTPTLPSPAPACQPSQLAGQFRIGGLATGNVFGELLIRNISASACGLRGAVTFYGVDAQGQRIAASGMKPDTLALVVLPPHTPAAPDGSQPAAGAYLVVSLMGAYRDDPNPPNGLCSAADEVTPAKLAVTIGSIALQIPNYDAETSSSFSHSISGCRGLIFGEGAALSS